MNLVLISGGQNKENRLLHQTVRDLCPKRKKVLRLTYIPYCTENCITFYRRIVRRYRSYGIDEFHCLPIDRPFTNAALKKALTSDIIYLAGGNTFYYLKHLRASGLLPLLRQFAQNEGVLVGLSAGAILLTANINLASIPEYTADENRVGLKNLNALNLTSFEFSPHFNTSQAQIRSLTAYSAKSKNPIYACPDGGGIVISEREFRLYGNANVFFRGERFKV